jgi:hypothetical protein
LLSRGDCCGLGAAPTVLLSLSVPLLPSLLGSATGVLLLCVTLLLLLLLLLLLMMMSDLDWLLPELCGEWPKPIVELLLSCLLPGCTLLLLKLLLLC